MLRDRTVTARLALALARSGLPGHTYAIDAMPGAAALTAPGPATVLTSDPEDFTALYA